MHAFVRMQIPPGPYVGLQTVLIVRTTERAYITRAIMPHAHIPNAVAQALLLFYLFVAPADRVQESMFERRRR